MNARSALLPLCLLLGGCLSGVAAAADQAATRAPPDTLEARAQGCSTCHGAHGQGTRDDSFPAIAGKPQGYLYNQLLDFRDGRRSYPPMNYLLAYLHDDYLDQLAGYFAQQPRANPGPEATVVNARQLARGEALVKHGDAAHGVPACAACHGAALTGLRPGVPGLLGLRSRYISGQLVAWRVGTRHASAPDCMDAVARHLNEGQITAVAAWLARQPVPADSEPSAPGAWRMALPCGSQP